MRLLITGAAGFIGFHLAKLRLEQGDEVIAIDNLNDYYDVKLKLARLEQLQSSVNFTFYQGNIADRQLVNKLFSEQRPERVVNLAAQAGVRYSLVNPHAYIQSNVVGFTNFIEACREYTVEHFVYASTSSVYGANTAYPYHEDHSANHPLTIYAASKKANEMIAHSYAHLYQLPTTGLRFFTVYGPWGRPDMAFFSFTRDILQGKPIQVFNHGQMKRDFTYIDDIVRGMSLVIDHPPESDVDWQSESPNSSTSNAPFKIYNVGCGKPVNLMDYIAAIEAAAGKKAVIEWMPMQLGDVAATYADTTRLENELGYKPHVNYREGVKRFVDWYKVFYC